MLKKILAASTASVLALTALASVAMADDASATADDYTLELVPGTYQTPNTIYTSAHITATLKTSALTGLLAPSATGGKAIVASDAKTTISTIANYSESKAVTDDMYTAASTTASDYEGKYAYLMADGTLTDTAPTTATTIDIVNGQTNGLKLIKIKKAPAAITADDINGFTYETVTTFVGFGAIEDSANPYNNLAMGLSVSDTVANWDDFKMTGISMSATFKGVGTDTILISGGTDEKVDQPREAKTSCTFADITGNSGTGKKGIKASLNPTGTLDKWVTEPAGMSASFGLSSSKTLDQIKADESNITVEFDVSMTNAHWESLLTAAGITWNNSGDLWSGIDFAKLVNESGDKLLNTFLGIEGTSVVRWATETGTSNNIQVGHLPVSAVGSTKATNVNVGEQTYTDHVNWFNSGVTQTIAGGVSTITSNNVNVFVGLGTTKNNILKNLNNGGTVTFTFDKDIRPQDIFNPYIIWKGGSGLVNMPLNLTNTYTGSSKELTLSFPAGLTWAENNTNFYNSFIMMYNLNYENSYNLQQPIEGADDPAKIVDVAARNSFFATGNDSTNNANYGAKLVKITFKANKEASNGGLVDPGNSGNSGTSTPSNSGSNGGDEQNPGTGVAVAVAPVILAAAGAAVVISKKRK